MEHFLPYDLLIKQVLNFLKVVFQKILGRGKDEKGTFVS